MDCRSQDNLSWLCIDKIHLINQCGVEFWQAFDHIGWFTCGCLRPHPSLDSLQPFNPAQICCQCAQVWVSLLETISTSGDQMNDLTFNSSWRSFHMDSVVTNSPTFFHTWSATTRLSSTTQGFKMLGEKMHQWWSPNGQDVFWSEPSSIVNCYHFYTLAHCCIVIVICMLLPAQKCHSAAWSDIYRFEQVQIVRWWQVRRLRLVCGYWAQGPPISSVWPFQWSWSAWYIFTMTLSIVYRCVAIVSVSMVGSRVVSTYFFDKRHIW